MASNKIKIVIERNPRNRFSRTRVIHVKRKDLPAKLKELLGEHYDPKCLAAWGVEEKEEITVKEPENMGEFISGINKGLDKLFTNKVFNCQ